MVDHQLNCSRWTKAIRLSASVFIGLAAVMPLNIVASTPTFRSHVLSVHIDSDRATYSLGQPIKIRVTFKNETSEEYRVYQVPPWGACRLQVSLGETQLPQGGQYGYSSAITGS